LKPSYSDASRFRFIISFDLVLFRGAGDLAWRKPMPPLFQAFRHGSLPEGGRIIGVARDDLSVKRRQRPVRVRRPLLERSVLTPRARRGAGRPC